MKYTYLSNTDLKVSKICLGCMGFGNAQAGMHKWTLDEENSRLIIKNALDHGINFFDTAMGYQSGTSEEYLGRALKDYSKREDVVIATKFFPLADDSKTVKQHIEECLEGSLKRLETDYIDLYILHMWDDHHPIEDYMKALYELKQTGKIKYIGVSNCYAWQLAKANEIAYHKGYDPFISIQGHYNLIFREEEREMVPYCHLHNVALTPYSALAAGRLAKRPSQISERLTKDTYAMGKYDHCKEADQLIIDRVIELADQKKVSMTQISLAWLMKKSDSPVVGATKLYQVEDMVKACDIELSDEEMKYLEELYQPHTLVGVMAKQK